MATTYSVGLEFKASGVEQQLRKLQGGTSKLDAAVKKTQGSFDGLTGKTTKAGQEIRRAANGMEYFIDAAGKARKVNGQFVTTTEAAAAGLKRQGDAAQAAGGGVSGLAKKLLGVAAGFATVSTAAALAGKAIQSAIGRTESERRLKILAASYGEVAAIQNVAAKSSRLFGQSQTETNQAIASAYARLRPLGISLQDISSTYNGFNTAARLSGATAQESSAAFTQLAQALGSGVLRGDEFNSIAEQAPGLLQAISKELGVAVGELRDYAQDGKITSDVVIRALKAIERDGAAPLAEAMGGPEQKLKDLQNETDNLSAEIGKLALPALIQVVSELTDVIKVASDNTKIFSQVMNGLGKEFEFILGPLASFYEYIGGIPGIMSNAAGALFSMLGPLKQLAELIAFVSGKTLGPEIQRLQGIGAYTGMADAPEDVRKALAGPRPPARAANTGGTAKSGGTGSGATGRATSGATGASANSFKPSSRAQALIAAAKRLGVSPLDLATIISYETAGTFSPSIMGGAGGNYQGLIQFGPPERRQYGAHGGQSFEEQVMGPVVRFFEDRFKGVGRSTQGASLLDLYKTVNGGNPNVSAGLSDGNGTIGGHVQKMMGGHRQKALATFFGGSQENTGYSSTDSASDMATGWDQVAQKIEEARQAIANFRQGMAGSNDQLKAQLTDLNEVNRLIMEGMDPSVAQEQVSAQRSLLDIEAQRREKLAELQGLVGEHLVEAEEQKKLEEEINALFNERKSLQGGLNAARAQATELANADKTSAAQQQIQSDAQGLASTLAGGLKNALVTAIKGGDVGAAFQQIAEQMGQKFLDIAFRQIEQALESMFTGFLQGLNPQQIAAQQNLTAGQTMLQASMNFLNAASMMGGGGGGGGGLGGLFGGLFSSGGTSGFPLMGGGSLLGNSLSSFGGGIPFFAEGGLVSSPTLGVIGEGGQDEVIIPSSKIDGAMSRYKPGTGARGLAAAMNGEGAESGSEGGAVYNFQTTQFMDREWVDKEQLIAAMNQAAKQGAAAGQTRTMSTLRNSRSQRGRIGL